MRTNFHQFQLINIIKGPLGGAPLMGFSKHSHTFLGSFFLNSFFFIGIPLELPSNAIWIPQRRQCILPFTNVTGRHRLPHSTDVWIRLFAYFLTSGISLVLGYRSFRFRHRVHVTSDVRGAYRQRVYFRRTDARKLFIWSLLKDCLAERSMTMSMTWPWPKREAGPGEGLEGKAGRAQHLFS